MENASKALIIAGAILLSIAIIGIGMSVFNNAQEAITNADMSSTEISAFNSKFMTYEGSAVRGSKVNTLLKEIQQNNLTNAEDESKQIAVTIDANGDSVGGDGELDAEILSTTHKVASGYSFEVEFGYEASGLIDSVTITKNT